MIKLYQGSDNVLKGEICFDRKNSYIYEIDDKIVGYFNLMPMMRIGCINIDYELLEEYRNKGLGNLFLKNISDYAVAKYSEYKKLLLLIDYLNVKSEKMAIWNGYVEDYFLFDYDEEELPNKKVYTKRIR